MSKIRSNYANFFYFRQRIVEKERVVILKLVEKTLILFTILTITFNNWDFKCILRKMIISFPNFRSACKKRSFNTNYVNKTE